MINLGIRGWFFKKCIAGRLERFLRYLFTGGIVVGMLYEVFCFLNAITLEPTDSPPARVTLYVIAALAFLLGTIAAISQRGRLRYYDEMNRKLCAIREMYTSLDIFREDARGIDEREKLGLRAATFYIDILEKISRSIFLSRDASSTFMIEIDGQLKIAANYPHTRPINEEFSIALVEEGNAGHCHPENFKGAAGFACCGGKTVYLPNVRRRWGVWVSPSSILGGKVKYKFLRKDIWKPSGRDDFKSMISAPAITTISRSPYRRNRYGALNIEATGRDAFRAEDFYSACVAASILAQGVAIHTSYARAIENL